MRGAWGIAAATWVIAACSSPPKAPVAPASVPCGYRAITTSRFAVAVPLFWESVSKRFHPSFPGERRLLTVDGGIGGVIITSEPWKADGKAWTLEYLSRLKNARFELVEQRPFPGAGDDAVLVEHRRWDSDRKVQWHDWRVLVVAGGTGFQMICRIDEDDLRTLGQVCSAIAETFAVAR